MTHDPLCEWSTPCIHGENQQHSRDTENLAVPDATYCWMCGADCTCDLIAKVREDMLAKCIAAVEVVPALAQHVDDNGMVSLVYDKGDALDALRALQEKEEASGDRGHR